MTGKSHKAIGVATGVAFAIYGIRHGEPALMLALVSAPLAAMLPDIDHSGSKIGQLRKQFANTAIVVAGLMLLGAAWYYGQQINNYTTLIAVALGVALPTIALFFLSQTKWFRRGLHFATKHRGAMHTLLIPICMFAASTFIGQQYGQQYFLFLLYGCVAGYVSHLLADTLTKKGCPILFPIWPNNIRLTKITTGSQDESIAMGILILIIIVIALLV